MIKNHQAIIVKAAVREHPNADRLKIANVLGIDVIVGQDTKDGDISIFFPEGTQLSEEYARENDCIRRKDADGNRAGGMFDPNRRVRVMRLRGSESEGYFAPLSSLNYLPAKLIRGLKPGHSFSKLGNHEICRKYDRDWETI